MNAHLWPALAGLALACAPRPAAAFPPYRSADAVPATPYELGVRLGLGRWQREGGETVATAPLLRAGLGLPGGFEVISQLEYSPRANELADGALGGRWATEVTDTLALGTESFALLPVRPSSGGVGVESLLLATVRTGGYRLHLNAGGFHAPRAGPAQAGWRASALAEVSRGADRFGVELFGKDSGRSRADLRAGVGLIHDFGRFDVRTAVHVGLTSAAPDVVTSLWVTTSFPVRR